MRHLQLRQVDHLIGVQQQVQVQRARTPALAAQLSAHAAPRLLQASTRTASATTSTSAQPPATPDALQALS
ncbi:hypothetical protein EIJ50_22940, partial [Xanthomonas perforans]